MKINNETAINTPGLEFSPTFYQDGIVFISTNTVGMKKLKDESLNMPAMSILLSRRNAEGTLSAPEPFAKELTPSIMKVRSVLTARLKRCIFPVTQ